ncbi:MAG: hypothetical protein HeimAB125_10940 [Candidatus Heimdallarchaeota archaeon AB_125]|nr:MAG: hypothetical protein HeimAB125_10940 [Candidatus Heimdallarchaeota archaeon AB_125]
MKLEFISKKMRVFHQKNFYYTYVPYLLAIISIITLAYFNRDDFAIIFAMVLILPIMIRITIILLNKYGKLQPEQPTTNWKELRKQLTLVLTQNKIILENAKELRSSNGTTVILSEEQVNGKFFEENEEMIKIIRKITIDGLLCLLFLVQQQPAIASVRAIQKSLKIPLTSVYRHLQKMMEYRLVELYYEPDKPSKALYTTTDEGSSLIIQLFDLIGGIMLPKYSLESIESKVEMET